MIKSQSMAERSSQVSPIRRAEFPIKSPGKPRKEREETVHDRRSLSHVKWDCKYHVVFIPKYRQKVFYGKMRVKVGRILRELYEQKGTESFETHVMPDHIRLCLSIPSKYSVSHTTGFLKGKKYDADSSRTDGSETDDGAAFPAAHWRRGSVSVMPAAPCSLPHCGKTIFQKFFRSRSMYPGNAYFVTVIVYFVYTTFCVAALRKAGISFGRVNIAIIVPSVTDHRGGDYGFRSEGSI